MNKKVLIISPYFPPVNAADMQRVRMSLPYFAALGWDATVVTVDERYTDLAKDNLLLKSIPEHIKIHPVKALNKKWTSKFGMGSIAPRSIWFYRQKVNRILKNEKFDLIYFSTTQFPVCVLGAYWKKRFGVPYIIDLQDPWYSEYYKDKPKHQQPTKYRLIYSLHKYLEPIAIKQADGLISVSENYINDLKNRYPEINHTPSAVITFGAFKPDFKIAGDHKSEFSPLLNSTTKNIVYIGRGGMDLHKAIAPVFEALAKGLTDKPELFRQLKLYFIGTSYAPVGKGIPSIMPLATQYGVTDSVIEITERISYYHTLLTLQQANALFIPGSDTPAYTASKIYPYILTKKPFMAVFNSQSPALNVLKEYGAKNVYSYDATADIKLKITDFFEQVISGELTEQEYTIETINKYSAENMTLRQCELFNLVLNKKNE